MPTPTQLRDGVAAVSTLAARDVAAVWAQIQTAQQAREVLQDVLPDLTASYALAAASLAADWYDDLREEADVAGRFTAIVADLDDLGADVLARWGIEPLFAAEPDWQAAQTLIDGGMQRRITNAARDTITDSTAADPAAVGWQRVGNGECGFCAMLIARGALYTEATVTFGAHDHCKCMAVPAWGGQPRPVEPYTPTSRNITAADRARVREYLREHDL